ncbi:MAG: Plug domain-containing protein [Halioglobus sp.]|nr:Plug domain-containing protein [Halioglobus sp.]
MEEVRAVARREFLETRFRPDRTGFNRDVSQLMARVPGGAANANGPLTGQIQYRGMSGPRVNVRVDGMLIHGGGPNWMAPPLHHIPTGLMEEIVVERGIPSIATGGGIGGAVTAHAKHPDYNTAHQWRWTGDTWKPAPAAWTTAAVSPAWLGSPPATSALYLRGQPATMAMTYDVRPRGV